MESNPQSLLLLSFFIGCYVKRPRSTIIVFTIIIYYLNLLHINWNKMLYIGKYGHLVTVFGVCLEGHDQFHVILGDQSPEVCHSGGQG